MARWLIARGETVVGECVEDCSVVDASGGADGARSVSDVRPAGVL